MWNTSWFLHLAKHIIAAFSKTHIVTASFLPAASHHQMLMSLSFNLIDYVINEFHNNLIQYYQSLNDSRPPPPKLNCWNFWCSPWDIYELQQVSHISQQDTCVAFFRKVKQFLELVHIEYVRPLQTLLIGYNQSINIE